MSQGRSNWQVEPVLSFTIPSATAPESPRGASLSDWINLVGTKSAPDSSIESTIRVLTLRGAFRYDEVNETLSRLKSTTVRGPAEVFGQNLTNQSALIGLSNQTIVYWESVLRVLGFVHEACRALGLDLQADHSPEENARIVDQAERIEAQERERDKQLLEDFGPQAWIQMLGGASPEGGCVGTIQDAIQTGVNGTLLAAITAAWTCLETLSKDLWVAIVNRFPTKFAQKAEKATGASSASGIELRQLSIGQIARYGFDLRTTMGDLLVAKFDFTSPAGIVHAYQSIFPEKHFDNVKQVIRVPELAFLEQVRHVSVHKAGVTDANFCERTEKHLESKGKAGYIPGSRLLFNGEDLETLTNATIKAACALLKFVDGRASHFEQSEATLQIRDAKHE